MQCGEVEMIDKIKKYIYTGSVILFLVMILVMSICLYVSNKKIENLKGVNDNLIHELSVIKEQVNEMRLSLDALKLSEKVTQDYVEKKNEIEDRKDALKEEVYNAVINNSETCDWWNDHVPDSISSILVSSSIMHRDQVCN